MREVELRESKTCYVVYVPKTCKEKLFLVSVSRLEKLESYGRYCSELPISMDILSALFDIDYGPLMELLREVLVVEAQVYNHPTAKVIHVPKRIVEEKLGRKVLLVTESELNELLRGVARKVMCYLAFQLLRRSKSLHQLFQSLQRMRETLEKSGIKVRLDLKERIERDRW